MNKNIYYLAPVLVLILAIIMLKMFGISLANFQCSVTDRNDANFVEKWFLMDPYSCEDIYFGLTIIFLVALVVTILFLNWEEIVKGDEK